MPAYTGYLQRTLVYLYGTHDIASIPFKGFLQLFHGSEANSNKPLKNDKKNSGIDRLVLPFPDT